MLETVVVGPFQCNCRILVCETTGATALIDTGDEPARIRTKLEAIESKLGKPLHVTHLFHTHAHLDHIGATRKMKEAFPQAKIWLHKRDLNIYNALPDQGAMFGFDYDAPLPVDAFFEDEQDLQVGEMKFVIRHTPGHSPGGVCLLWDDAVFSGDTLFQGSIGRTDLWEGDMDVLTHSIRTRLYTLDDDTRVCPGHGPDTKIGIEKRMNPFVRGAK